MSISAVASTQGTDQALDVSPYLDAIEARGPENRKLRRITDESIADLKSSGFIRSVVPKKWGGLEVTPQEFFATQIKIAERDMSTTL